MSIRGIFPIDKWNFNNQSVLSDLAAEDIEILMAHQSEQDYSKSEIIFREGSTPSGIFYFIEGKVKKYKVDRHRKEQIIYVANTGELLGYHAVLSMTVILIQHRPSNKAGSHLFPKKILCWPCSSHLY